MDTPKPTTTRNIPGLISWLREGGAVLSGADVVATSPTADEYGLIGTGEPLAVSIPQQLWLTAATALNDPVFGPGLRQIMLTLLGDDPSSDDSIQLSGRQVVTIFLCCVRAQNDGKCDGTCVWSPFVASLPHTVNVPSLWPDDAVEITLLRGTELEPAVRAKKDSLRSEFALFSPVVTAAFDTLFSSPDWFDSTIWQWANAVYWSRVLDLGQALQAELGSEEDGEGSDVDEVLSTMFHAPAQYCTDFMVPFIDYANHSATPNVKWSLRLKFDADKRVDSATVCVETVSSDITATELKGVELCFSYGDDKPNAELLFHYGFVCNGFETDTVGLPLPSLHSPHTLTNTNANTDSVVVSECGDAEDDGLADGKLMVLAALGVTKPVFRVRIPPTTATVCDGDAVSVTSVDVLLNRVVASDVDAMVLRVMMCSNTLELLALTQEGVISGDIDARVCNYIVTTARSVLDRMATEDELCVESVNASVRMFVQVPRTVLTRVISVLSSGK